MSTSVPPLPPLAAKFNLRSSGTKFFVVVLLALLMSLSGFFVEGLANDRAEQHHANLTSDQQPSEGKQLVVADIPLVDSYRSIYRSLHYITLFLGLIFLTYFLFEVMTGKSLHPAQYVLVGIAQVIFYLLLLSVSEHLGFDWGFLVAGGSTVSLFSLNTEWVFGSRKLALRALGVFAALYGFIYVLLRVESYALLVGTLASFVAVAAAMYVTRKVDWYGTLQPAASVVGQRESWLD